MTRLKLKWNHGVFALILMGSAVLNLYGLNQAGYGNLYYAAAVKSMLMNWHNFFFNSLDPNGFITIDKPPVAFWIQALFAWIFGFHGWALLLPQVLAGVASVAVLYHLVKRVFGTVAGLIAAAVMAVSPVAVAVQRTNEVDGMLVLVMLLATWSMWKAIETGKLRWLIWVGVLEGIGFNIKMMEAYLILPALYLIYWLAARVNWRLKIAHLFAMTAVLAALSFSWAIVVDLTPAADRPYIGSTKTNSEMELIFGYNGISRLTGNMFGGGQRQRGGFSQFSPTQAAGGVNRSAQGTFQPNQNPPSFQQGDFNPGGANGAGRSFGFSGSGSNRNGFGRGPRGFGNAGGFQGPGGGNGGMFNTGTPGVMRLFQSSLSGQDSWLLPIALLSAIPLLRRLRWRRTLNREEHGALYWLAWLLPMAVFYSIAGFFHQYYLITLAPGVAALTGAGLVQMWRDFRGDTAWKWFLPIVFVANVYFESTIVRQYTALRWPLIGSSVGMAVMAVILVWRARRSRSLTIVGATLGVLALLISPTYWAMTPIIYGESAMLPAAGPQQGGSAGGGPGGVPGNLAGNGTGSTQGDAALEAYLEKHYKASPGSYLVATLNATTAAPLIIDTGLPVMAMGGFTGSDPAMTVRQLAQLTQSGKLKYFLIQSVRDGGLPTGRTLTNQETTLASAISGASAGTNGSTRTGNGGGFGGDGRAFGSGGFGDPGDGNQSQITQWILAHSKLVPTSQWQSVSSNTLASSNFPGGGVQLYEYTGP